MQSSPLTVQDELDTLLEDYKDFNSTPITSRPVPTAVQFAKQVSKGYPCIYQAYQKTMKSGQSEITIDPNITESAAFSWTKEDLVNLVEEKVEMAVTPNGRADDLQVVENETEQVFLSPGSMEMTITQLLDELEARSPTPIDRNEGVSRPVYYLQSQNSNLTTTALAPILKHIPSNFPFAEPVLGEPEAINIWIGDENSVTSTHRDPYENLYLVLKGSKTFTLYPPVDEIVLPTRFVRTGKYIFDNASKQFSVVVDEAGEGEQPPQIPWVVIDPFRPREEVVAEYPRYALTSPRTITVNEGEILYLPSGWYHHVQQNCGTWSENGAWAPCIAVNYWYDMEYEGEKYIMRQLIGRLTAKKSEETKVRDIPTPS